MEAVREASSLRLTTVVAADVCGYSRLAEMDEAAAVRTVSSVFQIFEQICANRRGRIFHRAGDGFIAEFPSASDGVLAALEFTSEIKRHDTLAPNSLPAKVRTGVHVGDVTEQSNGDLLGHGVNIASRLQGEAAPGGVLVSLHTVNLVRGKIDARFHRRGPLALKNIGEPVVAFDVVEGAAPGERLLLALSALRNAPRRMLAALGVVAVLVLLNFVVFATFFNGKSSDALEEADLQARAGIVAEIETLSRFVIDQQPDYANQIQVAAVNDAVRGLINSPYREKRQALAQIKAGRIGDAVKTLEAFQRKQQSAGVLAEERVQTLKEIAALVYYSQPVRAREIYTEVLGLTANSDIDSLFGVSDLLIADGKADAARGNFDELIRVSRVNGDERLYARALIGRGRTLNMLRRLDSAREDFLAAHALADRNGWTREAARSLMFLGSNAYLGETYGAAEGFMRRAIAIEEEAPPGDRDEHFIAETRFSLGTVLLDQNKIDEADIEYDKALAIAERTNDIRNMAVILYNKGALYLAKGNTVTARKHLVRAREMAESEPGTVNLRIHIHLALAKAEKRSGDSAAACAQLRAAQQLYVESAHPMDEVEKIDNELGCA